MGRVHVIDNPLAKYYLSCLRDKSTRPDSFRTYMEILGIYLGFELSKYLDWEEIDVETPLAKAKGLKPSSKLLMVAILGASIPLVMGIVKVLPWAGIGLIAARRIEKEGEVKVNVYYKRLPENLSSYTVIVVDPMLATGKTIDTVLNYLEEKNVKKTIVATIIASKPGIKYIIAKHENVTILTFAIDPVLNTNMFIVPGLGDAGDRSLSVTFYDV